MRQISTEWVSHLKTEKEKEDFERSLRNSTAIIRRLRDILHAQAEDLSSKEVQPSDYDSPSWSYKQADRNGRRAQIRKLLTLLSFIEG